MNTPNGVHSICRLATRVAASRLPYFACIVFFGLVSVNAAAQGGDDKPVFWAPQHVVDLSHSLHADFPWIPVPGITFPFEIMPIANIEEHGVAANKWRIHEHLGTQIDAPSHFEKGGRSLHEMRTGELFAPIVVINFKAEAQQDPDAEITVAHLERWEQRFGQIPKRAIVIMNSGWGTRIDSQELFVNADSSGTMHFPGFSAQATIWLVEQRDIWGLGVDTISFDPGKDKQYRSHKALASRDRWAIEAMANLDQLPAVGATLFIGAINVRGATGGPVRPIAVWSDHLLTAPRQPDLNGTWRSVAPEPVNASDRSARHLIRELTFEDQRWSIHYGLFRDASAESLILSGQSSGTFEINNGRNPDGSFHADFGFEERKLLPGDRHVASSLTSARCGATTWRTGEPQSVFNAGCPRFRVPSATDCPIEYDVVRISGAMLYLSDRPDQGNLCNNASRPSAAGSHPLVRLR